MDKYSLYRFGRKVIRLPRTIVSEVRFAYQRVVHGWSVRDWWSIDYHIAHILSETLPKYVKDGHGVSAGYVKGDTDEAYEAGKKKRDKEYLFYADIFRRYCIGGVWKDPEAAKELEGVTEEEYKKAMKWLSLNFSALWD